MADFSIIIPHRGDGIGLWATIHSCEDDLKFSTKKYDYNYVIVTNGELGTEVKQTLDALEKSGRLLAHKHFDQPITPPLARTIGVELSDSEILFFFDNHCLVSRHYFDRAMIDMQNPEIDMLHSTTIFYNGQSPQYHYKLKLKYNFWAESAAFPTNPMKPYKIGAGGHGGFVIRKSTWNEIGGYGPSDLFKGYGGEEMAFDLKLWRLGKTVWLDPLLIHYHYNGNRGYPRHFSNEYYTNLLVSALVIGGPKWFNIVFESFITGSHMQIKSSCPKPMYDLGEIAYKRGIEYSKELDKIAKFTLDELLLKWIPELVSY